MSGRIIFMTEEESMGMALREIIPKVFPSLCEYEHWLILDHEGKSDLEASYPRKMKQWGEPGAKFVILRDNDSADCRVLKRRLVSKAPQDAPPYLIRIVCKELESWFIGDMDAIVAAYPAAAACPSFGTISRGDPDAFSNASDLLRQLTGTAAKRVRATEIGKRMQPEKNRSKSFEAFISGVRKLIER